MWTVLLALTNEELLSNTLDYVNKHLRDKLDSSGTELDFDRERPNKKEKLCLYKKNDTSNKPYFCIVCNTVPTLSYFISARGEYPDYGPMSFDQVIVELSKKLSGLKSNLKSIRSNVDNEDLLYFKSFVEKQFKNILINKNVIFEEDAGKLRILDGNNNNALVAVVRATRRTDVGVYYKCVIVSYRNEKFEAGLTMDLVPKLKGLFTAFYDNKNTK